MQTALLGTLLLLAGQLVAEMPARAQVEEDLGVMSLQSRRMLEEARGHYDRAEFAESIQLLDDVLAGFDTWAAGTLPVEQEEVRVEAYRLRGLAYYNLGQTESARADFAVLLRQQPDLQLDRDRVSPKILQAFDAVRDEVTGLVSVTSDPPGAEVQLDGRILGVTPVEPVRIPTGRYLIEVEKRGYSVASESIEVQAGKTTKQDYLLQRNARSVTVMTSPSGAQIFIDGESLGVTSGSPPPGYEIQLLESGINPDQTSAPLTLPFLASGQHVIRVEKPCFAAYEASFEVTLSEGELPLELETVVLDPSRSSLRIVSSPPGAYVQIDGAHAGETPLELADLCGEDVLVRVEMDRVGAWEQRVRLQPGRQRIVEADLRLTLASLGAVREVGVEDEATRRWDQVLAGVVQAQATYRPVVADLSVDGISPAHLELFRIMQSAGDSPPELDHGLRERLHEELDADLFLVALPHRETGGRVYLYGTHRAKPDVLGTGANSRLDVEATVELLDTPSLRTAVWSGLLTVETSGSDFPVVIARSPSAPKGTSLLPGDRVRSVAARPVLSRMELEAEFAKRHPGEKVPVTVERGSARVDASVVAAETPLVLRPGGSDVLANKLIADLDRQRRMATSERQANLAALGLGVAYLLSGEPERALSEGFQICRLPSGGGISAGTAAYFRGISLEALGSGHAREATQAFKQAAGEADATLWRDDGPLVAPLAAARSQAE